MCVTRILISFRTSIMQEKYCSQLKFKNWWVTNIVCTTSLQTKVICYGCKKILMVGLKKDILKTLSFKAKVYIIVCVCAISFGIFHTIWAYYKMNMSVCLNEMLLATPVPKIKLYFDWPLSKLKLHTIDTALGPFLVAINLYITLDIISPYPLFAKRPL